MQENIAVIILAAGMGTRMKSAKAKVLHEILGKPMILYVVDTAIGVAAGNVVVVIGHQAEEVRKTVSAAADVAYAYQKEQLGTGHAVLCTLPSIPPQAKDVVILCGDVPLIRSETINDLISDHRASERDLSLLAVEMDRPDGYGRILLDSRAQFRGIVEEADASPAQKKIGIINTGIYCVKKNFLVEALPRLNVNNAQGELYLTDIIEIGYQERKNLGIKVCSDQQQVLGINDLFDLERVAAIMRDRQL